MSIFSVLATLFLWACANDTPIQATQPPQYQPTDSIVKAPEPPKDTVAAKLPKAFVDSNTKVIYLTFDDGPLSSTPYVQQVIEEKQIKLSTFLVGRHANASKTLMGHLEAMRRSPHIELCNHSYTHANGKYLRYYSNPEGAAKEIMDNEDKLNLQTKIVRLPGRCIWKTNTVSHNMQQSGGRTAQILFENGYKIYGWDVEWGRYNNNVPTQSPERFVSVIDYLFANRSMRTPNHLVILAHDEMLSKERGRQDLRRIIDLLKERNYVFEFISHYPDNS